MLNYISTLSVMGAVLIVLSGCQTTNEIRSASTEEGMTGMLSCEKITSTFDAYDQDKSSFAALRDVAGLTGFDISSLAGAEIGAQVSNYYQQAKTSTNLALMLKGCQPIQ